VNGRMHSPFRGTEEPAYFRDLVELMLRRRVEVHRRLEFA